ncbi:hypothetical protein AD998_08160 [bacterium 336/3]|nr:hypothetical protein AD998_08160 [bacterium 336/3]
MENPFLNLENSIRRVQENQEKILAELQVLKTKKEPEKTLLTRKDIVKRLNVSLVTLHSLMKIGLPFSKVGRRTLFELELVENWLKQFRKEAKRKEVQNG